MGAGWIMLALTAVAWPQGPTPSKLEFSPEEVIVERLSLGQEAMARGNFALARDHFRRVLELDWNNPQVYESWSAAKDSAAQLVRRLVLAGDRRMKSGAYAEALVSYHKALRLDGTRADIKRRIRLTGRKIYAQRCLLAGLEHFLHDDFELARVKLDSALFYDPEDKGALALRERIESRTEEIIGKTNLKDDPETWEIHLQALRKYRAGEYRAAVELWEMILKKYPGNLEAAANIRQARLRLPTENQGTADLAHGPN